MLIRTVPYNSHLPTQNSYIHFAIAPLDTACWGHWSEVLDNVSTIFCSKQKHRYWSTVLGVYC